LQFICESVAVVWASLLIGLAIAQLSQPFFSPLFNNSLLSDILFDPKFLALCVAVSVLVGIMSALYPAISISRHSTYRAFRSSIVQQGTSIFSIRSMLVMVQLGMSTLLILAVLLIRDQLSFIQNKDLGYKKSNILTITNAITMENYQAFRNDVMNLSGVEQVYRGYFPGGTTSRHTFHVQGVAQPLPMYLRFIGPNFLQTFDIPLAYGRSVPDVPPGDSSRYVLINETGVRELGWTHEDAIGKRVSYTGGNDNKTVYNLQIIGVIKDANFESLYNPIQGSFFQPMNGGDIAIRLEGTSLTASIQRIEDVWKRTETGTPMEYSFLTDSIASQYLKEERLSTAILYFTSLAIAISCLGLIGLASFITQQRTKEIGIRKVHGATAEDISRLYVSYFLKLLMLALALTVPLGMYVSTEWLQNFAYHTEPGVEIVLKCVLISVTLILVSVVIKVVQASHLNPVVSIKHE
jgi:putative ABC transport system permease protein